MSGRSKRSLLRTGPLLALLLGTVVIPGVLFLSLGIVALALSRQAFDIVLGVLVLVFAVTAVTGGFITVVFLRRSERLAQMQSDFVANVSHELRTPLAGIRLLLETIEMGRADAPERRAQVLQLLREQTQQLSDLVEQVLRWRRLEARASGYELSPQPIAELVEQALRPFSVRLEEVGTRVEINLQPDLPPVLADPEAMVTALRNLIDNAIKFAGDRGPIELAVRRHDGEVVISVRDHGPGIPPQEHKRLFDRFYRLAMHSSVEGVGLGLAIVRNVVEGHRGRIHVESEPGVGATFILHLRAASAGGGA